MTVVLDDAFRAENQVLLTLSLKTNEFTSSMVYRALLDLIYEILV